jgi:uncharacterized protein (DUF2236 family)
MTFRDGQRHFALRFKPLLVAPSDQGLFPAGSVIRTVYGDASVTLGAGRALLLQLAHPAIAAGVHDHSDYERHPLDRLFGTLLAVTTVVFGSQQEAASIGAAVGRVHERVVGPGYSAGDPELIGWVNATLVQTAALLYQRTIRRLAPGELDELARDSKVVGEVFGCPLDVQPSDWPAFRAYWEDSVAALEVTPTARRVSASLLAGHGLPARLAWIPPLRLARAVTAATLPERIRAEYRLPWRGRDRALAAVVLGGSRQVLPRMPVRWRQVATEVFRAPPSR